MPGLRILFVLPHTEVGGTVRHALGLVQALRDEHDLVLLAPPGPLLEEFLALGVRHRAFPPIGLGRRAGLSARLNAFRRSLAELVAGQAPAVVHVHAAAHLALLARTAVRRIPIVLTIHGFQIPRPERHYLLAAWLARLAGVQRVIAVSRAEARHLARGGLRPPRLRVVHNGVGVPPGPPIDWRRACGWPPEAPVVGAVGRMDPTKGFPVLLDAFARLDPSPYPAPPRLVIAGSGEQLAALQERAAKLGIADRVHFPGHLAEGPRGMGASTWRSSPRSWSLSDWSPSRRWPTGGRWSPPAPAGSPRS